MKELINKEPKTPTELAEAYLKGELLLPIRSSMVEFFLEKSKVEKFKKGLKKVWDEIKRENISGKALKELEKDYDKKIVNSVLEALTDFEFFIRTDRLVNVVDYKRKRSEKREYGNILRATEYLLQSPLVLDSEKMELQQIKLSAVFHMWLLKRCKKVTVTPVGGFLLNKEALEATLSLLTTPDTVYVRPNGRPKKIFENALISVIYKLLKRDNKQIKAVYYLTVEVVKQLIPKVNEKRVGNALHSA